MSKVLPKAGCNFMFRSGLPKDSTSTNTAPKIVQRLLYEVMRGLNLEWNTFYSAKTADTANSVDK